MNDECLIGIDIEKLIINVTGGRTAIFKSWPLSSRRQEHLKYLP